MIFLNIYTVLSIFLGVGCCLVGIQSLRRRSRTGFYLALTCFVSAAVDITYLMSILFRDYLFMSLSASLYFISIDWVLVCLFAFCKEFVGDLGLHFLNRLASRIFRTVAIIETILFLINPFCEFSISYLLRDTVFAHYEYQMHWPYYFHLFFTYFMVFYTLFQFVYKALKTPAQYRGRYTSIALILTFIVLLNAFFLWLPGLPILKLLDVSTSFYCVAVLMIYWSCFVYGEKAAAKTLSSFVLQSIDQGIILFDYTDRLVLYNARAKNLLPDNVLRTQMTVVEFIRACGLPEKSTTEDDHYSIQCIFSKDDQELPVRCDYRHIKDGMQQSIGRMFVFTDSVLETDLLTGFQNRSSFRKFVTENPRLFPYPTCYTAVDISNLTTINSTFGSDFGDNKIRELSVLMKKHFPQNTYFVRGEDAILIAICSNITEDAIRRIMETIDEEYDLIFHYAVHTQTDFSRSILDCIRTAVHGMENRKIMDAGSTHSSVLNSLLRALAETDSDTEAHVQRTRSMGADLGIRIGLSDVDRSNLSLLCVLHDIGKIGIPLEILNKPGRLTEEEWNMLKTHVEKGYQIALSSPAFSGIAEMILYHHERWDGKGYPKGLSRESIPLLSRVISVVDAYDAMVSDRSYRKGMSYEQARSSLRSAAGSQFDPYIVSEFLQMLDEHPEYHHSGSSEGSVLTGTSHNRDSSMKHAVTDNTPADPKPLPVPRSIDSYTDHTPEFAVHRMTYSKYVLNPESLIIRIDKNFELLTGYSEEDVFSNCMSQNDLIPESDRTEYLIQLHEQQAESDIVYIEHRLQKKDGTTIYVYCIGEKYYDSVAHETRTQVMIVDSTKTYSMQTLAEIERTKVSERMRHWEDTYRRDSMTNLLNRAAFQRDVEYRLLHEKSVVMMLMMDVDRFKEYNDTYGHNEGDKLLVLLSSTLSDSLRNDDLSCRMGGDEFAAALFFKSDTPRETLLLRARQIFDRCNMTMSAVSEQNSLSMGIAIRNTENASFNSLYKEADTALYRSKNEGRARMTLAEEQNS